MSKLFCDDRGVSVIIGALLLILITVIAAAGLAMIVSQAEKQQADRQALEDAIKNENLTIVSIMPLFNESGYMQKIDVTVQNLNIDDAKIGSISLNDRYAIKYHCDGDHDISDVTRWLTVPASKAVVIEVGVNSTDFQTPPTIKNTDLLKVQVSTSHYNFFERTFKPPVAIAKFAVETENLGATKRDYIMLDASGSYSEGGRINYYNWTIKDGSEGSWALLGPINSSGNKIRFNPPSAGPFKIVLSVQDDAGLVGATEEFTISANQNFNPPISLLAAYDQTNESITATLYDTNNTTCPGIWINFVPTTQNITVWPAGGYTDENGTISTNITFNGGTTNGNVLVTCGSLTYYVQVLSTRPVADFTSTIQSGITPLTVEFTDNSGGVVNAWLWDFGDGTTSTLQNPLHTYTSVGSYDVQLTVTNAGGSSNLTKTNYITVNPVHPLAAFTVNRTSGLSPLDVQFSDTSTGTITGWLWDFGDGTTSTSPNPPHCYMDAGSNKTYTVKLTVSNAGGNNTITMYSYITINPLPPAAAFTSDKTSGQSPLVVHFTDTSTGAVTSWQWDFGDGTPMDTTQMPTHTYANLGQYNITLTVSNDGGSDTITKTNYIRVNPPPPAASFTSDRSYGQTPLTVQFTDTTTGGPTGWLWDFGDGSTSTSQNPIHTFPPNSGPDNASYIVRLTASNAGGSTTSQMIIMVNPLPPVAFFTADKTIGASPLTVQFWSNSSGSIKSFLWDFGDGSTSTSQNPIHTFPPNPGPGDVIYMVTLRVANDGGNSTWSLNITVNP